MDETRNVRNLIRLVSALVAWPALSAGLVMAYIDADEHLLHILLFVPIGIAAVVVFFRAGPLARRFTGGAPPPAD